MSRCKFYCWNGGCAIACCRAIAEADTVVCRSEKQIIPAISISIALIVVRKLFEADPAPPILFANPRLNISNSAPKIRPLTPASESILLVASEKQWIAPREQIRLMASTTIEDTLKLEGRDRG